MNYTLRRLTIKYILLILLIFFLLIQFYRPEISYQPVTQSDINVPGDVKSILKRSCYDCHSNQTNLKWFDQVVPAYWVVADHVRKGKAGLNFSEWGRLSPAVQKAKLWEVFNHIKLGAMPIESYERMHPEAKLSDKDLITLKEYISSLAPQQVPDTAKVSAHEKQYKQWDPDKNRSNEHLPTSPNGITYIPDYKNWQAVGSTERFDNGTMRIIFGNEIVVKAIKEHKTNPWPDGSIFAKVAWDQLIDTNGNITPGAFRQVEYMIKDGKRFASTKGWGWARFLSAKLEPYGKTAMFTTECINCHRPMKDNDFVFTSSINH